MTKEEIDLLHTKLSFWDGLSSAHQDLVLSTAQVLRYKKDESIYCCNQEHIGLLVVKTGILRVYITSEEGKEITLYRLAKGEICILSASSVLPTIEFEISVDAATDCEVIHINSLVYTHLLSENLYVELFSYKLVTQRFSDVMWAMQQILFISFDKRLAHFLIAESEQTQCDTIKMTHEEIAKYLGSAREVVSRMLKYFVTEGFVSLSRGGITIIDKDKLRTII